MVISCPECKKTYEVGTDKIGHKVVCKTCNKTFIVEETPQTLKLNSPSKGKNINRCTNCGVSNFLGAIKCKYCGEMIDKTKTTSGATKECPFCCETVLQGAIKCKHCGEMINKTVIVSNGGRELQNSGNGKGFAITSMILGILSIPFGFITGILALIFGSVAKRKMERTGNFSGKGMATAGIVLGYIATAIYVLLILIVIIANA